MHRPQKMVEFKQAVDCEAMSPDGQSFLILVALIVAKMSELVKTMMME